MTDQQILEKAIQKAYQNGWNNKLRRYSGIEATWQIDGDVAGNPDLEALIFNHDFAKALWGEPKDITNTNGYGYGLGAGVQTIGWQHRLQQMVIADDPIKYLGDNI